MVYKMIEKQSTTVNGPFHYVPECQMVQYLLPCYVASLIEMDKDPSVGNAAKLNYMHFLHEFIRVATSSTSSCKCKRAWEN
jgi:hypothetical protein